jgi:hypothetical protein
VKKKWFWQRTSSLSEDEEEDDDNFSEEYDPYDSQEEFELEQEEEEEEEESDDGYRDAFQLSRNAEEDTEHPFMIKQPIERLGPEDLRILNEIVASKHPSYKDTTKLIPEEELVTAVRNRINRLKKARHLNADLAFGATEFTAMDFGNITVPNLICVSGHDGAGGNLDINGIYERYPDNHHGRPVYQKYLERDIWEPQPQQVEFWNNTRASLTSETRTFPAIQDTPRTKKAMHDTMMSVTVLPAKKAIDAVGDFRKVHKQESWFLYFDDHFVAWCIGPRPGSGGVLARCKGVDEAIPDCLGPDRWEVFDVGHRIWVPRKNIRTKKGGAPGTRRT